MNYLILFVQVTFATVVYALLYLWYVAPRLADRPLLAALQPLLWVQAFRFTGLTLVASGQVDQAVDRSDLLQAGLGDMVAGLLALAALLVIRLGSGPAVPLVWALTVWGLADFVNVGLIVARTDLISYDIGAMWLALIWYVPLVLISHLAIIALLLRERRGRLGSGAEALS